MDNCPSGFIAFFETTNPLQNNDLAIIELKMRLYLFILLIALPMPADAASQALHLLGLSFTADDQATSLEIDLSARAPLSTIVKPDRIEIDLPTASWDRSFPVKGGGGGLIESYRKLPTARGIAIVMRTNTRTKIDSSQGVTADDGSQHITIRLVPDQETVLVAPPVLYEAAPTGPVVQERIGSFTETVPAAAVPVHPAPVQKQTECASHLLPAGRLGDAAGSYPVYKFSDCP